MSLEAGHQLAHYEILEPIGKGGMGEVCRARDGKLGRGVAIKVLPDEFAEDTERLRRFQREAKVLASLNHPKIAAIYGLEQSEGTHYLVLELVPGETLAERIARGPIAVEEALQIGLEITEALEGAHEQSVVHRDLKPPNVKLTPDDDIKVLDFGLAKAFGQEKPYSDSSMSPTLTRDATRAGVIMGTASYMSPEQAKGKKVDARTDIFAFGAVLYEMLTGKKSFPGEGVSEMLAAVIKSEPDWNALPAGLDPRIVSLLGRCLRKDRKNRRQSIGDVRVEIQEILDEPAGTSAGQRPVAVSPSNRVREGLAWGLLVAALVTGIALWPKRPAPPLVSRFALTLQEGHQLGEDEITISPDGSMAGRSIAISPDGRNVIYLSRPSSGGVHQLYVRPMDPLQATVLPGTEGAQNPFFSPDSQWIGFSAQGELKKVSLSGGAPVALCEVRGLASASWSMNTIVFASRNRIFRVSSDGGTPERIAIYEDDEFVYSPEILPGARAVLYSTWPSANIVVESLDTGQQQILTRGTMPHYLTTGHLLFTQGSSVLAARFNLEHLEMVSSPVPVLHGVRSGRIAAQFQVSSEGALVYVEGGELTWDAKVVLVNRDGAEQTITDASRGHRDPRLSPDGKRVAVDILDEGGDIWIIEQLRGTLTPLTFGHTDHRPLWSPDGKRVFFLSGRTGEHQIFQKPSDGSGTATQLTTGPNRRAPTSISSDGKTLVFREENKETGQDIGIVRLDADQNAEPEMFLQTKFNEHTGMVSPDDRWLAYVSDDSGREEVYVTPFPGPGGRQPISTDGGTEPLWSRDGRELYYRNREALMAVTISAEPSLTPGKPTLLFAGPYRSGVGAGGGPHSSYDVTPDGRFVMIRGEQSSGATQILVVLNWFEELERLVPTGE